MRSILRLTGSAAAVLVLATGAAKADLNLYCSAQPDWCELMARSFEAKTGIDLPVHQLRNPFRN